MQDQKIFFEKLLLEIQSSQGALDTLEQQTTDRLNALLIKSSKSPGKYGLLTSADIKKEMGEIEGRVFENKQAVTGICTEATSLFEKIFESIATLFSSKSKKLEESKKTLDESKHLLEERRPLKDNQNNTRMGN